MGLRRVKREEVVSTQVPQESKEDCYPEGMPTGSQVGAGSRQGSGNGLGGHRRGYESRTPGVPGAR